jgi:nicotinate-nucleotide pyrophosphorylase (carboxylating)
VPPSLSHNVTESENKVEDLRDKILSSVAGKKVTASILADDDGIVVGTTLAKEEAEKLGFCLERVLDEGSQVRKGDEIARFCGNPKQVVMAEDVLMGVIAKPSGVATAARKAVEAAGGRPQIVCGAWKKMPRLLKDTIRRAAAIGGALPHISPDPFVYLDKNYVELLGGIKEGLEAVADLKDYLKVVQLKGRHKDIVIEARQAVEEGADILLVDTGRADDVKLVVEKLLQLGLRDRVKVAFSGGIRLEDIDKLKALDIDILCIGRQIVDAPLLDMRLEVVNTDGDKTGGVPRNGGI